ncbi:2Fe-2S iron-sulfur cluster-binding protein [Marinobacterium litorale]|uniref:2Fe-2S iron-sulfur cluster-binding protein n=1 Tax=Marinobacterium litorale TaxID=404770 RepID=UPI00040C5E5D|nr:2Fe-2S iron-sulfur cluster-binding protein [Marinobacterium litorale]
MTIEIQVTDDLGQTQTLNGEDGNTLMELLRDESSGVDGVCGGCAACGTCHIVVAEEWHSQLPPPGMDEEILLEALNERTDGSRLSCQIRLAPEMSGMALTIVPAEC